MSRYRLSDGSFIDKSTLDYRVTKAKKLILYTQIDDHGYNFCEDCERSTGVYLDCSHDISVDECQKSGHAELAYSVDNITVRCRDCHNLHG